jgi:uncharacterized C2H2 Zn-finger protein
MAEYAYLDVSILRCPYCGKVYADSSWYVVDMESDIECGVCGKIFNTKKNLLDRVLVRFAIEGDKVVSVKIDKRVT